MRSFSPKTIHQMTENSLRQILASCCTLAHIWEKEFKIRDWALIAWEKYYSKNLDSYFLLKKDSNSLQGLACVSPDISVWVKNCTARLKSDVLLSDHSSHIQNSSWSMFLQLLGVILHRGGSKAWLSVKGRILTKLTEKKLLDMSSIGVYNVANLMLTYSSIVTQVVGVATMLVT